MHYETFKVKAQQLAGVHVKLYFLADVVSEDRQHTAFSAQGLMFKNQPVSRNIKKLDEDNKVVAVYNDDLELIEEIEPKGWTEIEC